MVNVPERDRIGLPPRVFMYTPDQLAQMLELTEAYIRQKLLWYDRRTPGIRPREKLRAVNIAPEGESPEWRVMEPELLRYLRLKGVKFYDRGYG